MSRKRGKKHKAAVEAVPDDVLAEGSGPVRRLAPDAIATVEDVVTTEDIATTDDVVTADDVVATAAAPGVSRGKVAAEGAVESPGGPRSELSVDAVREVGDAAGDAAEDPSDADQDAIHAAGARGRVRARRGRSAVEADLEAMEQSADDGLGNGHSDGAGDGADDRHAEGDGDGAGYGHGAGNGHVEGDGEGDGDGDDDAAIVFPTSAAGMDAAQLKHLVEALIFASDRPLTVQRLRQLTRVGDVRRLEQSLAEIAEDYRERGIVLQQVSGGLQFRTRTQFSPWVQQLIAGRPVRLSRAQLETLAIIAYRQPITRPEIDDIRGVDSTATLKLLIDRMLIRVLGKREEVGRPILYGTTKEFLDFFSLADLRELPTLREYSELTAESRKVMSDRLGLDPEGNGSAGGGSNGHSFRSDTGHHGGGIERDPMSPDNDGDGDRGGGGRGDGSGDTGILEDDDLSASASARDLADVVATFLSADAVHGPAAARAAAEAEAEAEEAAEDAESAIDAGEHSGDLGGSDDLAGRSDDPGDVEAAPALGVESE